MTEQDLARLKEQYARQTARWNELKARFAALPLTKVRVPRPLLEQLRDLGGRPLPMARPPKFGVRV